MENVTDRRRNPFGVAYPCDGAVGSYGDANADVHLIGDHPGRHGDGVPFSAPAVAPLRAVLRSVGLIEDATSEVDDRLDGGGDGVGDGGDDVPAGYVPRDLFCSYLCACPAAGTPSEAAYARLEPSFGAKLRAVAAHVLLPVGDRALAHVLAEYTSKARTRAADAAALHATEVPGRGFLVVPVREPAEWTDGDADRLHERLAAVLSTDYRRTADLGRFVPGDDAYLVR